MEVTARGHAGYGVRGQDIVCAGVSALLYGYMAYLDRISSETGCISEGGELSGSLRRIDRTERDGYLRWRTAHFDGADELAWNVTEAGLSLIAEAYPECLVIREESDAANGHGTE